jgi:hypothetical protein
LNGKRTVSETQRLNSVWKKGEIDREQVRVVCVFAVAGITGVVRLSEIGKTFAMSFLEFGMINYLDVLMSFWIAYLLLMVFAVSDDLFGFTISFYARAFAYVALVGGAFFTTFMAIATSLVKSPLLTAIILIGLSALFYLVRADLRRWISSLQKKADSPM